MTGLDPTTDTILQIACLVTDHALNILDPAGYTAVIRHPPAALAKMDEWCTRTHAATGLTDAVLTSPSATTADEAAAALLAYIRRLAPAPRTALLAGNSVHADRAFLARPPYARVVEHLHYRLFDVSAIKEAARRWAPDAVLAQVPRKRGVHEARQDILESIDEARFYRKTFFLLGEEEAR
jgi:oligoribonuclease